MILELIGWGFVMPFPLMQQILIVKGFPRTGNFQQTFGASIFFLEITPPKFNIAPEKWWLEDEFPFGIAYFQGLC